MQNDSDNGFSFDPKLEEADLYDLDPQIKIKVRETGAHTEVCSTGISCCPTSCHL